MTMSVCGKMGTREASMGLARSVMLASQPVTNVT
jgi:hypothetical protein